MKKGITAAQNINALRWFLYYGVTASWNILYGFPGETNDDYIEQTRLIQKLVFLPPPSTGAVWLERFSPYFREAQETSSFRNVRPHDSYRLIYPGSLDLQRAAYFFEGDLVDPADPEVMNTFLASVEKWKSLWKTDNPPILVYQKVFDGVRVIDKRNPNSDELFFYTDWLADVFLACVDRPVSIANIQAKISKETGRELSLNEVSAGLDRLICRDLVFEESGLYLALPLPLRKGRVGPALRTMQIDSQTVHIDS
jgi:hypothetical protein